MNAKTQSALERAAENIDKAEAMVRGLIADIEQPMDYLLQYFAWEHLPPMLQNVSKPFQALAVMIVQELPQNPERTVALRKLLESKDCAVRAAMFKQPDRQPEPRL